MTTTITPAIIINNKNNNNNNNLVSEGQAVSFLHQQTETHHTKQVVRSRPF